MNWIKIAKSFLDRSIPVLRALDEQRQLKPEKVERGTRVLLKSDETQKLINLRAEKDLAGKVIATEFPGCRKRALMQQAIEGGVTPKILEPELLEQIDTATQPQEVLDTELLPVVAPEKSSKSVNRIDIFWEVVARDCLTYDLTTLKKLYNKQSGVGMETNSLPKAALLRNEEIQRNKAPSTSQDPETVLQGSGHEVSLQTGVQQLLLTPEEVQDMVNKRARRLPWKTVAESFLAHSIKALKKVH